MRCSNSEDSVEFDTIAELVQHEKGGHQSRPKKELPLSKPVEPSATELKAMEEAKKLGEIIEYDKESPPIIIKPLELQYKWTGIHAPCNTEPRTIEVGIGDFMVAVVAFCFNCNEKLGQLEVPEIETKLITTEKPAPITKKK